MRTLPIDISILLKHIHTQFEKIRSNKSFEDRMCYCREKILEEFTIAVEKLLIKFGSRTLKFLDDYNLALSTDISDIYEWFNKEVYDSLYNNDLVSNEMILSFQLIQQHQDKKFFDIIQEKYINILKYVKEDKEVGLENEMNDLYDEIRAWYELFLYIILSTQFNCQSFKTEFLSDNGVPPDSFSSNCSGNCEECIHHNADMKCKVHEGVLERGEAVYIIMNNDFINDMFWVDKLLEIVTKYHKDPQAIKWVFDYRMYDQLVQCHLSHDHYLKIIEIGKMFKHVKIRNWEGINFNGFYDDIVHLLEKG